jgi:hypothetical protein
MMHQEREELKYIKGKLENHEQRIFKLEKKFEEFEKKMMRPEIQPRLGENHLKKRTPSKRKSTEDYLIELIDEGFFREKRTLSQIRDALHCKGRVVKLTDLPSYVLKLVRNNILKREKKLVNKRMVWVYFV